MDEYAKFIEDRCQVGTQNGFPPVWLPDFLFDFQRSLVDWAVRKGRCAIFADCGLGKTPMQLVWAENVVRQTSGRVLILTPIAVGAQTVREAHKFGVQAVRSVAGEMPDSRIVVTNYQRLHHFNPSDFAAVVCDESSILKNFDGTTKAAVTEFMRTIPYRLLCTATAAPNDYVELGTSAEALGEMGFQDMATKFFRKGCKGDRLGWSRVVYSIRPHAERDFWRWVCSWARAVRKPSDLGFPDDKFILPQLVTREHLIKANTPRPDVLFDVPAVTLQEQREERRRTLPERCEKAAELVKGTGKPAVVWCHLNDEGDMLTDLIPGAVQVSGNDSDKHKEEVFEDFAGGHTRVLVTKPTIAGFGLNWQHCAHQTFFPSHSFEQWYQAVRRCLRFGQTSDVVVDVITSEGEEGVLANLNRKAVAADEMFAKLVALMNDSLRVDRGREFPNREEIPEWLSPIKSSRKSTRSTAPTASR